MGERKQYDWEAIERDYRAGVLSIREVARAHGCSDTAIRKRATEYKWERDLAAMVRRRTQEKLVRSLVRKPNATPEEIIEESSETTHQVLILHRQDINKLKQLEQQILDELLDNPTKLYITQFQGEIIEKTVGLTASERAQAANNLANVQHKRIALERQAYSVDDGEGPADPVEFNPSEKKAIQQAAKHIAANLRRGGDDNE